MDQIDETDSFKIDWLQGNWEMLVERPLQDPKISLVVYGDGADNGRSSRILDAEKLPTFEVVCKPRNEQYFYDHLNKDKFRLSKNEISFDRFVRLRDDDWYYEEPPFDMVLCLSNEKERVLAVTDVWFDIRAI